MVLILTKVNKVTDSYRLTAQGGNHTYGPGICVTHSTPEIIPSKHHTLMEIVFLSFSYPKLLIENWVV